MAGLALDDAAHRRDFVGIKDRAEVAAIAVDNRRQRRRHAQIFMREYDAWLGHAAGGAQRMQRRNRRLADAHPLLEIPHGFVLARFDAELLPQDELELAD